MSELWIPRYRYATEGNLSAVIHEARFAGGIAASSQSESFGGQLYIRDSLRIMRDTMRKYPSMTRSLFSILPQIQGTDYDETTNESPDALPHQVFRQIINGLRLPDEQLEYAEYWAKKWGIKMKHDTEQGYHFATYNSSDGPPLYVISLEEFSHLPEAHDILIDKFLHRPTGSIRTVGEAAHRCLNFIMRSIDASEERGSGLYIVPNTNPLQTSPSGVTRDGFDAYFHPEGEFGHPIDFSFVAYLENQALVYDALRAGAKLFPYDNEVNRWLNAAEQIRARTLEAFLMSDTGLFAAAIDTDGRQVMLKSNSMGELLNGSFLKFPGGPEFVSRIVLWLYSTDVMTEAGPRMLSNEHSLYEKDYYAYQGTSSVWPFVNGVISEGLGRHWGLPSLSHDLGILRTLGSIDQAGSPVELLYIDKETAQPVYHSSTQKTLGAKAIAAEPGHNYQAWSASGGLKKIWNLPEISRREEPGTWQHALASQALSQAVEILPAASNASRHEEKYYLDTAHAQELKHRRAEQLQIIV